MPRAGEAFLSLNLLCTAACWLLPLSRRARLNWENRQQLLEGLAAVSWACAEADPVRELLRLLEEETILVIHAASLRGWWVRIARLGDNLQLHTLLAEALLGSREPPIVGPRPHPKAVAAAKDLPPRRWPQGLAVAGVFDLLSAGAWCPDGTLTIDERHRIPPQAAPGDIPAVEGVRIVLLGSPGYPRRWAAGRRFPMIPGQLELVEELSETTLKRWTERLNMGCD
jgi:hypothetical protein